MELEEKKNQILALPQIAFRIIVIHLNLPKLQFPHQCNGGKNRISLTVPRINEISTLICWHSGLHHTHCRLRLLLPCFINSIPQLFLHLPKMIHLLTADTYLVLVVEYLSPFFVIIMESQEEEMINMLNLSF